MRVQVMRADGKVEVLNFLGNVIANETNRKGQSSLLVSAIGITHFFTDEGRYDGFAVDVSGSNVSNEEMKDLIDAIERDREVIEE